jgi:hypothetical protein
MVGYVKRVTQNEHLVSVSIVVSISACHSHDSPRETGVQFPDRESRTFPFGTVMAGETVFFSKWYVCVQPMHFYVDGHSHMCTVCTWDKVLRNAGARLTGSILYLQHCPRECSITYG